MSVAGFEIEISGHAETGMRLMHPGAQPKSQGFPIPTEGDATASAQPALASFLSNWQSQLETLFIGA